MTATDPVPELVERALDEVADVIEHLTTIRNAVGEATLRAWATHDTLNELRAATNSIELTEHPDEVSIVLPTRAALQAQRRRRREQIAWAVGVVVLIVAVVWAGASQ